MDAWETCFLVFIGIADFFRIVWSVQVVVKLVMWESNSDSNTTGDSLRDT